MEDWNYGFGNNKPDKWHEFFVSMIALVITVIVFIVALSSDFEIEIKFMSILAVSVASVSYFVIYIRENKTRLRKQETGSSTEEDKKNKNL